MHFTEQLSGASLQEIGLGGRHYTTMIIDRSHRGWFIATVLRSTRNIAEMCRSDALMNSTITGLTDACVKPCA